MEDIKRKVAEGLMRNSRSYVDRVEIFQSDLICEGEFPSRPLVVEHKIFWTCVI